MPAGYPALDGNWLTFGGSKRYGDTALFYGTTNIEQYASRIETRPTFDLGANWAFCGPATWRRCPRTTSHRPR